MLLTEEQIYGLGIALNESSLLGIEVDPKGRIAAATFSVLTLPEAGPPPLDARLQFIFSPVGRVAASLRHGTWDDATAKVESFPIEQLLQVVEQFKGGSIYGWEFIDVDESKDFRKWLDRLSLDFRSGEDGLSHTIDLFQSMDSSLHLDVRLWFDEFVIRNPDNQEVPLDDFIAGGKRWWDGLYGGDQRTQGHGIAPLKRTD
jgi:hypothetical protein